MFMIIDGREVEAFPGETILQDGKAGKYLYSESLLQRRHGADKLLQALHGRDHGRKPQQAGRFLRLSRKGRPDGNDGYRGTSETSYNAPKTDVFPSAGESRDRRFDETISCGRRKRCLLEKTDNASFAVSAFRCAKRLGASAISTVNRGTTKKVSTPYDRQAAPCIGCASCAGFCPTKCIEVEDTEEGRTIWNKKFPWVKCEICGKIVSTDKHYKASTGSDTGYLSGLP